MHVGPYSDEAIILFVVYSIGLAVPSKALVANTHDVNLDGDYYVLFGRGGFPLAGELLTHTGNENPTVYSRLVNILN